MSLRDAVESPAAAARVTLSRVSALEREPCREVAAGVGCMLLGAWLLAGAWLLERSAAAAESGAFSAPPECGDRRAWLGAVRARLPPLLQTHPLLDTFSLRIERLEDGEYAGEIGAAGAALEGARSVRGETCADVFDASSFIVALGLERLASARLDARAARATPPDDAAPVGVDGPRGADAQAEARGVEVGAAGFALIDGNLTPGQSVDLGLSLRLGWAAEGWQPLLLLGAYSAVPDERSLGGGRLRFTHVAAHVVGCPWRFPEHGVFGLRPCLELDVGRTRGEGRGVARAESRSSPWLSAGAQLRAELEPWRWFAIGVSAAAVVPFWRAHFYLEPDLTGFTTPALGFRAESFASLSF